MAIKTNGIVRPIYILPPTGLMATLMAVCAVSVLDATTLESVVIEAGQMYNQTTSAPPALVGYLFVANYNPNPLGGTFSTATLTCPATCGMGTTLPVPYTNQDIGPAVSVANTLAGFQAALPSGTYTFSLSQPSGPNYTESLSYTNQPASWLLPSAVAYVTNFNDLQGMNPNQAFTLNFAGFMPNPLAASNALTAFVIEPTSNPTAIVFQDFVSNTATNIVIPAGTLQLGVNYTYYLGYMAMEICGNQTCPTGVSLDQEFSQNTYGNFTPTSPASSSPEPSTLFLLGATAVGFAGLRRVAPGLGSVQTVAGEALTGEHPAPCRDTLNGHC